MLTLLGAIFVAISFSLASAQYNVANLANGYWYYISFPQTNFWYMAYSIWSDAPVKIYTAQGSYCSISSLPSTYLTACTRLTASSGFLPTCTQYSTETPMCIYIYCVNSLGCSVSFNTLGYANDPGSNALPYISSWSSTPSQTPTPSRTTSPTASPTRTPSNSPTVSLSSTTTLTASPTPSKTRTPSNTALVTPSSGSAVLRVSFIFSGSSGTFTDAMQSTIITSAASTLAVPRASIGWLGVTDPSAPGISRLLQSGARVQLSVLPAAASSSSVIQASMVTGNSLSSAVTSTLSTNFTATLASQPDAATLASALGYVTTAAMISALSLDANIPISALVMSVTSSLSSTKTPSSSPTPSQSSSSLKTLSPTPSVSPSFSPYAYRYLSPGETGALVSGILFGCGLALYFITICIVACCVKYACCCNHAHCKNDYADKSLWCRCIRVKRPMVLQAPPVHSLPEDFSGAAKAPYPYPPPYGFPLQQGYPTSYPQQMAVPYPPSISGEGMMMSAPPLPSSSSSSSSSPPPPINPRAQGSSSSKTDLFLSYAWGRPVTDEAGITTYPLKEKALKIHKALVLRGYTVWLDDHHMAEASAEGGVKEAMASSIRQSSAVVCCISAEYAASVNCKLECDYAHVRHKPVFWVNVGTPPSTSPPQQGYDPSAFDPDDEEKARVEGWLQVHLLSSMWADCRDDVRRLGSGGLTVLLRHLEKMRDKVPMSGVRDEEGLEAEAAADAAAGLGGGLNFPRRGSVGGGGIGYAPPSPGLTLTISLYDEGPLGFKPFLDGSGRVLVESVKEGGQAAAGGFKVGDELIRINGVEVNGGGRKGDDILSLLRVPHRPIIITIFRMG